MKIACMRSKQIYFIRLLECCYTRSDELSLIAQFVFHLVASVDLFDLFAMDRARRSKSSGYTECSILLSFSPDLAVRKQHLLHVYDGVFKKMYNDIALNTIIASIYNIVLNRNLLHSSVLMESVGHLQFFHLTLAPYGKGVNFNIQICCELTVTQN